MARKKQKTYSETVREVNKARDEIMSLVDHILDVMGEEMDYGTIAILGDLPDVTIRRTARLIFTILRMFVNLAELEKGQQAQAAGDGSEVTGELWCNSTRNCFEVWDTETDEMVGRLRDGMSVELFTQGKWIPGKVHVVILASWFIHADKDGPVTREACFGLFDGLQIRLH